MRSLPVSCLFGLAMLASAQAQTRPHNVVLFVADGLRAGMVTPQNAPTMDRLMKAGVRFTNTHSLYPTFTMPNATAMATGHMLGDTGQFGNTIYTAFPVPGAGDSLTPFLESDPVLGDVDEHFAGNYLNEDTILAAARAAGLSTATIGKLGPTLVFDHTQRTGQQTIVVDDSTGGKAGIPLGDDLRARLSAAGLPAVAPSRGANGKAGGAEAPGTLVANVEQQAYFAAVATKAVLPLFKERGRPFALVFWSRDPDGSQHNQGDSLGRLVPGINGPTSLAAIRNADDNLAAILAALREQGLADTTDVVLTSDHGFSTISKESATSYAATQSYKGVPAGQLPPGFVAIDLARDLGLPLLDPDAKGAEVKADSFPIRANGLIGPDPLHPELVVATNGGSDLVYVPNGDKTLAKRTVEALSRHDYVSGMFVSDALGPIPARCRCRPSPSTGPRSRRCRPSWSTSGRSRPAAPIRRPAGSRSPTRCCSRARACTAASRARTPATSWVRWVRASGRPSRVLSRRATPIWARRLLGFSTWVSRTKGSWSVAC